MISEKAVKLIMEFENDPSDYLGRPEWPGEESGITIGFGWDLGHTPWDQTATAWQRQLPQDHLNALLATSGRRGEAAKGILPLVAHIPIPYSAAEAVFREVTIPTWTLRTLRIYPQAEQLHGDCLGALVMLVFNRGPAVQGPRRAEMLQIQEELKAGKPGRVPELILNMKRLWPDNRGLQRRRDAEAKLFQDGLLAGGD